VCGAAGLHDTTATSTAAAESTAAAATDATAAATAATAATASAAVDDESTLLSVVPTAPSVAWITALWAHIGLQNMYALAQNELSQWPLLPLTTGELASCSMITQLCWLAPGTSSLLYFCAILSATAITAAKLGVVGVDLVWPYSMPVL
jgi:hypothetical protein